MTSRDDSPAGDDRAPQPATATAPSGGPPAEPKPRRAGRHDDKPVLPSISRDETDVGWGDEPSGRDDEWYRRERPPHHG